jgi:hypothetical protein
LVWVEIRARRRHGRLDAHPLAFLETGMQRVVHRATKIRRLPAISAPVVALACSGINVPTANDGVNARLYPLRALHSVAQRRRSCKTTTPSENGGDIGEGRDPVRARKVVWTSRLATAEARRVAGYSPGTPPATSTPSPEIT